MKTVKQIFLLLAALLIASPRAFAAPARKNEAAQKKIALSFDDGPSRVNCEKILSILEKYQIRATFFVIGENAAGDEERIRRIFDAGHEIGNHTYTHACITRLSEKRLREEVKKTEEVLIQLV